MEAKKGKKRGDVFVSNDKSNEKTILFPGTEDPDKLKRQNKTAFIIGALTAIIGTVVGTLIVSILLTGNNYFSELLDTPKQIHGLNETIIPDIRTSVENLETKTAKDKSDLDKDIENINTNINSLGTRIDDLYSLILIGLNLKATNEYSTQIVAGLGSKSSMDLDTSPVFTKMVAVSSSGAEFSAEELSGLKLLLPYKDGAKNCYFYGQLNDNNQWDGNCIVNVYNKGVLELITDAEYIDGKLVSCKQVFPDYTTGDKEPIWVVSNRIVEGNISHGETWHFFREGDFYEVLEPENVTANNILSVEAFKERITTNVEGYYNGTTSNGWFNDNTGNAYIIKYFRNGLIKTLYVGNFQNGVFNDLTESAWMIGKKNEFQIAYSYYKGPFENGIATGGPDCWDEPLKQREVDEYITQSGVDFRPDLLKWEHPKI